jgi:hypothetical protein
MCFSRLSAPTRSGYLKADAYHKARDVDRIDGFAAVSAIVRMSDVDFEFLYGGGDCAGMAKSLIEEDVGLVVVTRGIKGAQAWHREAGAIEVAPNREAIASCTRTSPCREYRRSDFLFEAAFSTNSRASSCTFDHGGNWQPDNMTAGARRKLSDQREFVRSRAGV